VSSTSSGGEHDSTGLRAELKAEHTALAVRVARKHGNVTVLPRRHSKLMKRGASAPLFCY
jgi:hypothetical protein